MNIPPFHLAIQVRDIKEAKDFYVNTLGCHTGRSDKYWLDLNFFGHQLVCHLNPALAENSVTSAITNLVEGHEVPVPHFGIVMEMEQWEQLVERLQNKNIQFIIQPYIRFKGQAGEQATLFFYDPSGNAIEIKAFKNIQQQLFATDS